MKDYDLPELDDVEVFLEYNSGEASNGINSNDSKRVAELVKEITLLKEEHA